MNAQPWLRTVGLVAAIIALVLDQTTKLAVLALLPVGARLRLVPWLDLRLGFNEGVSFGMFSDWFTGRQVVPIAVALAVVVLLAVWIYRAGSALEAAALGAVAGGALSNVADRMRLGAVVDFLDVHVGDRHWPAFNLADSSIVAGVAILVASALFGAGGREPDVPDCAGPMDGVEPSGGTGGGRG